LILPTGLLYHRDRTTPLSSHHPKPQAGELSILPTIPVATKLLLNLKLHPNSHVLIDIGAVVGEEVLVEEEVTRHRS